MTKCIVIGEKPIKEIEKKIIRFDKVIDGTGHVREATKSPSAYQNLELISRYSSNIDLIFAYDHDRSEGVLYLGKWNDGIV